MDNYNINLSINSDSISPIAAAVQGDTGRTLECKITDWTIPSGATGNFYALKPSGKYVQKSATVSGNAVTVELDNQILAEPGLVTAQIEIMQSGEKVKSFSFFIKVGKSLAGDWPESENEPTYLDDILEQMQEQLDTAIQASNNAASAANTAASNANAATSAANSAAAAANEAAETVDSMVVDFGNTPITFTQAASRSNISSGDTVITAFGKIAKWFADLGNSAVAAFQRVANNLTTTQSGYVLDARQGKSLSDRIGELNALATSNKSSIVNAINELNSNIGSIRYISKTVPYDPEKNTADAIMEFYDEDYDKLEKLRIYICNFVFGYNCVLIIQTYHSSAYCSILALSYGSVPIYLRKNNGTWLDPIYLIGSNS